MPGVCDLLVVAILVRTSYEVWLTVQSVTMQEKGIGQVLMMCNYLTDID